MPLPTIIESVYISKEINTNIAQWFIVLYNYIHIVVIS